MKFFKKSKNNNLDLIDKIGNKIYFGPFSSMKIPEKVFEKITTSEILGLYESCLHSNIENLLNKNIENILLIGGNNGYYASGLTYLLQPKNIYIYETFANFHEIISSWFELNNLKNFYILGEATIEEFKHKISNIDFVFMDCEGYEVELLNPKLFLWQVNANFLIELHPFYVPNLIATLSDRFKETHEINLIYDDFEEDNKIKKILKGLDLEIEYPKHPNHRWIIENEKKVYTSGIFMFLSKKQS
jgi:hypothetical protein